MNWGQLGQKMVLYRSSDVHIVSLFLLRLFEGPVKYFKRYNWTLRFSHLCCWGFKCCRLWRRVIWKISTFRMNLLRQTKGIPWNTLKVEAAKLS